MSSTWLDDDEWTGGPKRPADRSGATQAAGAPAPRDDQAPQWSATGGRASDGGAWEPGAVPVAPTPRPGWQPPAWEGGGTGWGAAGQPTQELPPASPERTPDWTAPDWAGGADDWRQEPAGGAVPPPPSAPRPVAEERPGRRGGLGTILAAALVAAIVAAGVSVPLTLRLADDGEATADGAETTQVALPAQPDEQEDTPADETPVQPNAPASSMTSDTVADVAEAVLPSVAVVEVSLGGTGQGSGSAVVFREDGYLVTNNHVIDGASEIRVQLFDGRTFPAEVVGTASSFDLAVLRVDATDLDVPGYAEDDPRVGETAIAIGAPFGFNSTVTSGIVSATGRSLSDPASQTALVDLVQTDAAINPGNSGGALVNASGQVIGINTAIVGGGTNDGVGFAVPTSTVVRVGEQLIEQGFFEYAQLGVTGFDLQPSQAEQLGLDTTNGAFIDEVLPGSGAGDAGITAGEIVVGIDGEDITSMSDLSAAIRERGPGDVITLDVVGQDGQQRSVEVTLGGVRTND